MNTLIVFSHRRWQCAYQRPQHLMAQLAQDFRVLFVEEPVPCSEPAHLQREPQGPQLEVLVPHTPAKTPGFRGDQLPILRRLLEACVHEADGDCIAWLHTPAAMPLLDALSPRLVVYDCMDDVAASRGVLWSRQREDALLATADLVLTDGPASYEAKRRRHPNVHYLPAAVDAAHFAPRDLTADEVAASIAHRVCAPLPRPRLGYFGVVDERLDLVLLDALAMARPAWQLLMVGPVMIDAQRLPRRANLHWLGAQPYAQLPQWIACWDACLVPFAVHEPGRCSSPTKLLEYMAGEKPVVSTAVPDVVSLYGDAVHIAGGAPSFIQACTAALSESAWQRNERIGRMLATVHHATWAQHGRLARELLKVQLRAAAAHEAPSGTQAALAAARQALAALPQARRLVVGDC